eukprot:scaffold27011_cov33-Tisochrysis_lutea.AAC.1
MKPDRSCSRLVQMFTTWPLLPNLPVLPAMCTYASGSSGSIVKRMRSTLGKSKPRSADSCATITLAPSAATTRERALDTDRRFVLRSTSLAAGHRVFIPLAPSSISPDLARCDTLAMETILDPSELPFLVTAHPGSGGAGSRSKLSRAARARAAAASPTI